MLLNHNSLVCAIHINHIDACERSAVASLLFIPLVCVCGVPLTGRSSQQTNKQTNKHPNKQTNKQTQALTWSIIDAMVVRLIACGV